MKNTLILILFLSSTFCSAQSPDDHVVYPDTSLIIVEIHGIEDTGYWHETTNIVPFSCNVMERSEDTLFIIDFEPIVKNVLKDILNQNKPVMKKFEYNIEKFSQYDNPEKIKDLMNRLGSKGWRTTHIDTTKCVLYLEIEIIE